MCVEKLLDEIHIVESLIEKYAVCYNALEDACPSDFKTLMLINGWHSPFIALNELLRRICDDESLLKKECKAKGIRTSYKSRYRELEALIRKQTI